MSPTPARLEVVAGKAVGMSILVDDGLLIGRHADGAGRLADDEEISRSHARVSLDRSGYCAIEDLGSTNGTYVNGLRIKGPQALSEGDTVEVGATTLVVRELPGRLTDPQLTTTTLGAPARAADGAPATLSLQLEVDFEAREARVAFLDGADALRLLYADGDWRLA